MSRAKFDPECPGGLECTCSDSEEAKANMIREIREREAPGEKEEEEEDPKDTKELWVRLVHLLLREPMTWYQRLNMWVQLALLVFMMSFIGSVIGVSLMLLIFEHFLKNW